MTCSLSGGAYVRTRDHVFFWLPEDKTLEDADNAYSKARVHALDFSMDEVEAFADSDSRGAEFVGYRVLDCEVDGEWYNRECVISRWRSIYRLSPEPDRIYRDQIELSAIPAGISPRLNHAEENPRARGPIFIYTYNLSGGRDELAMRQEYLWRLSEALPDWVYIYHVRDGREMVTPVILNAGEAHFFI